MEKEFRTIEEQIKILKSRNLIIDKIQAKEIFEENNLLEDIIPIDKKFKVC